MNRGRGRFRGRGRSPGRGRGRGRSNDNYEGGNRHSHKSHIQCHYCRRYGHYESECRIKRFEMNKQRVNFVEENEESGSMFFTCNVAEEFLKDVWFLDSGCSNHMTGNKKLFSKLDESVQSQVKLGDKTKVPVMGKGIISIKTKQGEKKSISDVYFAPGLEHNLLSVGQLIEKGYPVIFQNNKCVIYDRDGSNKVTVEVSMTNNQMFPLKLASGIPQVLKVFLDDESWLWHMRFGHLSFHGLHLLYKKHMVNGLPMMEQKDQVCEGCIIEK
eukprot:Gb_26759 [translate_table: standard]